MDQEVIPIPECTSMLNGYYLTRRPYTESLVHFYLVHAATGEQQFLLDAYDVWAVTPTGLYCNGGCRKMRQKTFPISGVRLFTYRLFDMDGYCFSDVRPEQTECT